VNVLMVRNDLRCGSLTVATICLSACLPAWRYGAADISRGDDTKGVPTYYAFGKLYEDEQGEEKATKVMLAACPDGNPKLLDGYVTPNKETLNRDWNARFTCNHPIPGF